MPPKVDVSLELSYHSKKRNGIAQWYFAGSSKITKNNITTLDLKYCAEESSRLSSPCAATASSKLTLMKA